VYNFSNEHCLILIDESNDQLSSKLQSEAVIDGELTDLDLCRLLAGDYLQYELSSL